MKEITQVLKWVQEFRKLNTWQRWSDITLLLLLMCFMSFVNKYIQQPLQYMKNQSTSVCGKFVKTTPHIFWEKNTALKPIKHTMFHQKSINW